MKNLNDIVSGVDEVLNSAKHGNFEEVLAKTRSYAERATKKSAERLEISKKKIELLDSKTKLAKAYEKFGKLQYSAYEGNEISEEELDACLQEIQLQKSRADLLDAEISELRAVFVESSQRKESVKSDDKANRKVNKNDIEVEADGSSEE